MDEWTDTMPLGMMLALTDYSQGKSLPYATWGYPFGYHVSKDRRADRDDRATRSCISDYVPMDDRGMARPG